MSSLGITIITLVGVVAVAGLGIASYYYLPTASQAVTEPAPTANESLGLQTARPLASLEPTPSDESVRSSSQGLPSPQSHVQGTITQRPASPTPQKPTPSAVGAGSENQNIGIAFVDTPSQVASGQSFEVKWQVTGPAGTRGENTQLKLSYETHKSSGGSNANSSVNNSSSFGSFTVPKVFSSRFSFGGDRGEIHLTAQALVDGKTVTTSKVIQLR